MNYLEVDFLFGIAFDLNVTPAVFASYCAVLQSEMAYLEPPAPVEAPRLQLQYFCGAGPSEHDDAAAVAVAPAGCHHHNQQQPQLTV
uniref:Uncharacterized protein n=1 Tax=Arundo donax TaxID=35708 RepID=A0A0A9DHZ6_ARUDO